MLDITFDELMSSLGCEKYPECFRDMYFDAVDDISNGRCSVLFPEYYDELYQKYGTPSVYRDSFKEAAIKISQNEYLKRFLALLCRALDDRENATAYVRALSLPKAKDGAYDIAYEMLGALAAISKIPYAYENMKKRRIPEHMIRDTLLRIENGIFRYAARNNGKVGYFSLEWNQRAIDGRIFRIGRLEYDVLFPLMSNICVLENSAGDIITLATDVEVHKSGFALGAKYFENTEGSWIATLEEDDVSYTGYAYAENGYIVNKKVSLLKSEWKKILSKGDPVIGVHIPESGPLYPDEVDRSIEMAKEFFLKHFPEWRYKAFYCGSYLMDPQLTVLLGEDANISKFCMRFHHITCKSAGNAVFNFVFKKPDMSFDIADLPENTRLERALKKHYQSSKAIYEMQGYFLP